MKGRPLTIFVLLLALAVGLSLGSSPGPDRVPGPELAEAAPAAHPLSDAPWTTSVRINDVVGTAGWGYVPSIAVDSNGNAYAVWTDERNGHADIYFSYRPSGGTWESNVRVNDDVGSAEQYDPSIAVDPSGNAYAVWVDERAESPMYYEDIYFSYRPAGGSWGPNLKVNDNVAPSDHGSPSIAVDPSGNAYAVWDDFRDDDYPDIYFSYRPAGGSWGPNVKVNGDTGSADNRDPSIAVDPSGNAYALWTTQEWIWPGWQVDIYFSYRPVGGSWQPGVRVNEEVGTASDHSHSSIAVDSSGNAYSVWTDVRNGHLDVYFSYRPTAGAWQSNVRVNDDVEEAPRGGPSIAVDPSGNAHAVWYDARDGDADIYFSYRPAGGSWGSNVKVNDDPGGADQLWPSIAVHPSGNAYAVWQGEWDIYFSYRPAGGPSPVALSYIGPSFLPAGEVMLDEIDGRITMGDHVHLRLPFRNNGSQTLSNVTVAMTGGQYTASSAGVSIHNGSNWSNQQTVQLTPTTIGPGGTGFADFWIYATDNDPVDRQSLSGQTWLQVRTATGQWTIRIALSPISFGISANGALKSGSCLHNPDNFEIQKYAQYAAGAWTMSATPTNGGDPDTPEQAVRNVVGRVHSEFSYTQNLVMEFEPRRADTELLTRRYGDIGVCRHYADLTTGLLRSLGLPSRNVVGALWNSADGTAGHGWVESYLNTGSWRQADSTSGSALYEGVYEDNGWTVKEAWADKYALSSASSLYTRRFRCASECYTKPVNPVNCALCRVASEIPNVPPDLSCVEDATSRYHQISLAEVGAGAGGEIGIQIQAPTFVTRTLPFSADTSLSNESGAALGTITATVSISATVDSTDALFEVFPTYQVATDLDAGETVTVTWTITPLVSGSGVPLGVSAYSGDLFAFDEKPLVVNEPGSLPDLTLDGICGLETALPGGDVALAAYVLDENLQGMPDVGTVVTATVYATPTVQFTTTVNLSYSETSGMYEEMVNLPGAAPIGSYEVDFVATHSGYDPDTATTFFAVRPPLTTTLETNVDTLPVQDTLTMTVGVWDRGAVITEASVWAEIITPAGVITAPLTVGSGDAYTLSLRPFDLRADLGGQVPAGNWVLQVTVDYQGSGASAERAITVRPTACVPLVLKGY